MFPSSRAARVCNVPWASTNTPAWPVLTSDDVLVLLVLLVLLLVLVLLVLLLVLVLLVVLVVCALATSARRSAVAAAAIRTMGLRDPSVCQRIRGVSAWTGNWP